MYLFTYYMMEYTFYYTGTPDTVQLNLVARGKKYQAVAGKLALVSVGTK